MAATNPFSSLLHNIRMPSIPFLGQNTASGKEKESANVSTLRDGDREQGKRERGSNLHGHVVVPSALFPDCLSSAAFLYKAAESVTFMSD